MHGLLDFLYIYVDHNKIYKFESLLPEQDLKEYKKNIIKYKIKDF